MQQKHSKKQGSTFQYKVVPSHIVVLSTTCMILNQGLIGSLHYCICQMLKPGQGRAFQGCGQPVGRRLFVVKLDPALPQQAWNTNALQLCVL